MSLQFAARGGLIPTPCRRPSGMLDEKMQFLSTGKLFLATAAFPDCNREPRQLREKARRGSCRSSQAASVAERECVTPVLDSEVVHGEATAVHESRLIGACLRLLNAGKAPECVRLVAETLSHQSNFIESQDVSSHRSNERDFEPKLGAKQFVGELDMLPIGEEEPHDDERSQNSVTTPDNDRPHAAMLLFFSSLLRKRLLRGKRIAQATALLASLMAHCSGGTASGEGGSVNRNSGSSTDGGSAGSSDSSRGVQQMPPLTWKDVLGSVAARNAARLAAIEALRFPGPSKVEQVVEFLQALTGEGVGERASD